MFDETNYCNNVAKPYFRFRANSNELIGWNAHICWLGWHDIFFVLKYVSNRNCYDVVSFPSACIGTKLTAAIIRQSYERHRALATTGLWLELARDWRLWLQPTVHVFDLKSIHTVEHTQSGQWIWSYALTNDENMVSLVERYALTIDGDRRLH